MAVDANPMRKRISLDKQLLINCALTMHKNFAVVEGALPCSTSSFA